MDQGSKNGLLKDFFKNPAAVIILVIIILFLIVVLIPQSFWVNLSMKYFK